MTCYSALAWLRLGQKVRGRKLLQALLDHARRLARAPARLDYFATSLPSMLLFVDDPASRQYTQSLFLEAQARLGLGQTTTARRLVSQILRRNPAHADACDLLSD
jgi:hypothetical protein